MRAPTTLLTALAGGLLTLSGAAAESFRCGTNLIREGMTAAEIEAKCGAPDAREVVEEPILARNARGGTFQVGVTTIERWTYDRGAGRFEAHLTIEDGVAKTIELGGRD
jgi:hypothetical protein